MYKCYDIIHDNNNDDNNDNDIDGSNNDIRIPAAEREDTYSEPSLRNTEGGMIRLETRIELKFLNSSCSSLSSC